MLTVVVVLHTSCNFFTEKTDIIEIVNKTDSENIYYAVTEVPYNKRINFNIENLHCVKDINGNFVHDIEFKTSNNTALIQNKFNILYFYTYSKDSESQTQTFINFQKIEIPRKPIITYKKSGIKLSYKE